MKQEGPKIVIGNEDVVLATLSKLIRDAVESSQNGHPIRIIVSGGSVLRFLNQLDISFLSDWSNVVIYFADERCVPRDDAASNCGCFLAGDFFKKTGITRDKVYCIDHSMYNAVNDCSDEYNKRIERSFENLKEIEFDLALLGVGEDGHTASLFPGHALESRQSLVMPVFKAPKLPATRITLTLSCLDKHCRERIFIATGKGKNTILKRVLVDGNWSTEIPFSLLLNSWFLLDEDSGKDIKAR